MPLKSTYIVSIINLILKVQFMCLGTTFGALHLLDHLGHSSQQQEFPTHGMPINAVSIDSGGDYIASCSADGKVKLIPILFLNWL